MESVYGVGPTDVGQNLMRNLHYADCALYCGDVNVLAKRTLLQYAEEFPEAREALLAWYDLACKTDFSSFAEVQTVFTAASWVGPEYIVFNIKGNHFRLITTVDFTFKMFRVKAFMRHSQYDRWTP